METESRRREEMKVVVVAIDEGEGSRQALAWAAEHLDAAVFVLLHVQPPVQHYFFMVASPGPAVYATSSVLDSVKKAQEENTANILARARELCKEKNVKFETLVLDGEPKDMICQVLEQREVDLVVVGSRGLGTIKRAFLGSVSDYVAYHANCPVLIFKPPKEQHH